MNMTEEKISSEEIYNGKVIRVTRDKVTAHGESGVIEAYREVVHHHGGVCVAAFNDRDEIALVRQFRYAYGEVVTELPAGKLEKGELPDEAVKRELREEVGAEGVDWRFLGNLYPSPGYCNEIIRLYTCRIAAVGETDFDEDENLECEFVPFEKAVRMALAGELPDSKTQTIILKLAAERAGK